MYATLEESSSLAAARTLGETRGRAGADWSLPALEERVCAEAGLWAPDAARRALVQSGGDLAAAVALVRVWAAALPHVTALPVDPADVHVVRRISAAYPEVPGGQWLGAAPELGTRLLDWADGPRPADEGPPDAALPAAEPSDPTSDADAPTRAATPRVRDLVVGVPVLPTDADGDGADGADPARSVLVAPFSRTTRLGVLARAETSALVSLASLVLARRREAVLVEGTSAVADVRIPHPRTGVPCRVATVPISEVEAVLDADVEGRPGFAVGWGASFGHSERRTIALALLDGAVQAGEADATTVTLDATTVVAATDGAATHGFVEHLRLPHYASFASYLAQAGGVADPEEDHA